MDPEALPRNETKEKPRSQKIRRIRRNKKIPKIPVNQEVANQTKPDPALSLEVELHSPPMIHRVLRRNLASPTNDRPSDSAETSGRAPEPASILPSAHSSTIPSPESVISSKSAVNSRDQTGRRVQLRPQIYSNNSSETIHYSKISKTDEHKKETGKVSFLYAN